MTEQTTQKKRGDRRPYGTEFWAISGFDVNWNGSLATGTTVYGWFGIIWPTRETAERMAMRFAHQASLLCAVTSLLTAAIFVAIWVIGSALLVLQAPVAIGVVVLLAWLSVRAERMAREGVPIDEYHVIRGGWVTARLKRLETTVYQGEGTAA